MLEQFAHVGERRQRHDAGDFERPPAKAETNPGAYAFGCLRNADMATKIVWCALGIELMGFNKRKMEDQRRQDAEKEAAEGSGGPLVPRQEVTR
jgi:hypothetical protein